MGPLSPRCTGSKAETHAAVFSKFLARVRAASITRLLFPPSLSLIAAMSSSLEPKSRYTCVITNVSNSTPTRDIEKEADYSGKIRYLTRHADEREVLVEFDR